MSTINRLRNLLTPILAGLAVTGIVGCAANHPAADKPAAPRPADTASLTASADAALKRGDCLSASESYARAAAGADVQVAHRATQVAMACEELPAAWQSATRWRTLAPDDREANALYAAVALKLYKTDEARDAITAFWHAEERHNALPAAPVQGKPGALVPQASERTVRSLTELSALLVEESDASAVLTAMSGALEPAANSPEVFILLGELALSSYDGDRAKGYAERALGYDPKDLAALRVLARAYVMRGDSAQALATARQAKALDPRLGGLELAQTLASLDRNEEAHQELERLRANGAPSAEIVRQLALLAFNSGDYKEARQRFTDLLGAGEGNDGVQLYLADISVREGDRDGALQDYRRLYDSSVAVTARERAAAILLERHSRTEALALLDDYAADHPEDEFDLTLAKARLLADNGEPDAGLALLNAELERHPQHPTIEYERAVILEESGQVNESVQALEHLLQRRPQDPTLLNALGYTLADHSLDLPHAEDLIRSALKVMPDNPAALDSLGWVRFRAGDNAAAAKNLERAYSLSHDGEIAAHWGEVMWVSGDHNGARRLWAAALARDPDSKPLKATLKRFLPDAK